VVKEGSIMPRPRKYNFNLSFFKEIDTQEKAYWLGVLFADGNINTSRNRVTLSSIDKEMIWYLKRSLGKTAPIKSLPPNGMHRRRYYLDLCSKEMMDDLIRHGCGPRKTFVILPPVLDPELVRHFIRGLWDGDGTVDKNGKNTSVAGTKSILEWIRDVLHRELGLFLRKIRPRPGCYILDYGGAITMDKLRTYLYKDATIFLPRKRDRFFITKIKNPNYRRK